MGYIYIALKNIIVQKEKSLAFFLTISLSISIILFLLFIAFGMRNNLKNGSGNIGYLYSIKMTRNKLNMTYRGVSVGQEEIRDLEDLPYDILEYLKSLPDELKLISIIFRQVNIVPYKDQEIIIVGEFSPFMNKSENLKNQGLSAGSYFKKFPEIVGSTIILPGQQEMRIEALLEEKGTEEDNIIFYKTEDLSKFDIIKFTSHLSSVRIVKNIINDKFPDSVTMLEISGVNNENNLRSSFFEKLINYFGYIIFLMTIPILLLFNVFGLSIVRGREMEIAVLRALGFKKKDIALLVFIELSFIGVASVFTGILFSLPLTLLIQMSGFLPEFSMEEIKIPLISGITFIMTSGILSLSGIIPVSKAARLDPMSAFRTIN